MPANDTPKKSKTWIWPALFVVGLAAALIVSGLGGHTAPGGIPVITSADEYNATLAKANAILLEVVIEKWDAGQKLTDEDNKKLREASLLYDELNLFNPTKMGPYFASGRIHLIFGENQIAAQQFRQAIDDSFQASSDPSDKVSQLTADSKWYLATAYENQNDFVDALPPINEAIVAYKNRPDYRYTRARALIQLKKIPEAVADLKLAIKLNPADHKSASLLKFLTVPAH